MPIDNQLDLSPALNFFSRAIQLAHEQGKHESTNTKPVLTEVPVSTGYSSSVSLYDELPNLSFKKYIAEKGTVYNKESCKGYHKIVIVDYGRFTIEDEYGLVTLPDTRKFFYLIDGTSFEIKFLEDSCFYCVSLPS